MSSGRSTRAGLAAIVGAVIIVGLGIAGFALGRSGWTSEADAREAGRIARGEAFVTSYQAAFGLGRTQGFERGLIAGEARGSARGSRLGGARGLQEAERRAAAERVRRATRLRGSQARSPTRARRAPSPRTHAKHKRKARPRHMTKAPAARACPGGQVPVEEEAETCAPPERNGQIRPSREGRSEGR
jgi:hypothetical protein